MRDGKVKVAVCDVEFLGDETRFGVVMQSVSNYRRGKILNYHFAKDRILSLGVGWLLDSLLQNYGLRERDMVYEELENGKPIFSNYNHLHFNLSHSESYAVAAIGAIEVGVDIEHLVPADEEMMKFCFHLREIDYVRSLPLDMRSRAFTRFWSVKESYLKAIGKGLNCSLTDICVDLMTKSIICYGEKTPYTFVEYELPQYCLSVCGGEGFMDEEVDFVVT